MNGGDHASPACARAEAGAWGLQEGSCGCRAHSDIQNDVIHCQDTVCLLTLHFQFMTQGNIIARNFLEHTSPR